jgi:type VI secretion system secreted protein Hcp
MAATNVYLKLDGIDGESQDQDHDKHIEVMSWSWGVDNPANFSIGQGGQATQAHIGSINIQKVMDKSSVTLFKNSTTGKHIASGTLSCMKLDGDTRVEYFKVDFTNLIVSSVQWSGGGQEQATNEHVALVFEEFKQKFKLQEDTGGAGGATDFGFNVQTSVIS